MYTTLHVYVVKNFLFSYMTKYIKIIADIILYSIILVTRYVNLHIYPWFVLYWIIQICQFNSRSISEVMSLCFLQYHPQTGGSSWLWSYDRYIYNYLFSQWLSTLKLWPRIPLRRDALNTTLCDTVCHWLAAGRWFSLGTPVSSINITDSNTACALNKIYTIL